MTSELTIAAGQYSDKGRKPTNQDFHGVCVPSEPLLSAKGVAVALADGISSSEVSHVASESTVKTFLEDYYCTSQAWSVRTSGQRVLTAINSWLYAQTRQSQHRYDMDRGYVCTLSALVLKSNTAHLFHVGDTRIYRLRGAELEQLTEDHRVSVAQDKSYLARALGIDSHLEVDYQAHPIEPGDVFLLATDGVHEHASPAFLADTLRQHAHEPQTAARRIVEGALAHGSTDNLTAQVVRIITLPSQVPAEIYLHLSELPLPPLLEARMDFDGYRIVREVHASSRSHIYLALDSDTGQRVILKTPSIDLRGDPAYLERFLMEEWVARRIASAHVLEPCAQTRKRNFLYVATEFIEGRTLAQWMIDNPRPELEAVRGIVEQIAKGLQAFHRLEMLHQDLRPENIMIDATGTVKIIDFGSARVAGIVESSPLADRHDILGTVQYTAPEYFLGEAGTPRSDLFSLGVITYQMLTGRLPYGAEVAKARSKATQKLLHYDTVLDEEREIPAWIDDVLRKAVQPDPGKRYQELSEYEYDLRHPNQAFLSRTKPSLIERNPVVFWKVVSLLLALAVVVLLGLLSGRH
ncbi:MAG: bifunctional protein-serine/threonine kinase/phosphatase [Burkholderiales bacterium]|nr:bifunctional protein-serine/threonine kinase/phosphatase [Burkholderiales bacterium]